MLEQVPLSKLGQDTHQKLFCHRNGRPWLATSQLEVLPWVRPWNYHFSHCHGDIFEITSHTGRKTIGKGSHGNHTQGDALFRVHLFGLVAERAGLVLNDRLALKCKGLAAKHKHLLHSFLSDCIGVTMRQETPLPLGSTWKEMGGRGCEGEGLGEGRVVKVSDKDLKYTVCSVINPPCTKTYGRMLMYNV